MIKNNFKLYWTHFTSVFYLRVPLIVECGLNYGILESDTPFCCEVDRWHVMECAAEGEGIIGAVCSVLGIKSTERQTVWSIRQMMTKQRLLAMVSSLAVTSSINNNLNEDTVQIVAEQNYKKIRSSYRNYKTRSTIFVKKDGNNSINVKELGILFFNMIIFLIYMYLVYTFSTCMSIRACECARWRFQHPTVYDCAMFRPNSPLSSLGVLKT